MRDQGNSSDVVRARKFELVDAAGKVRGGFTTVAGEPSLVLFDSAGKAVWGAR